MFNSMLQSHAKLSENLTEKNKSYIIAGIDLALLTIVAKFFEKLNRIFDILEFGSIASIQNVAPSYYALQNAWEIETGDDPITRVLKRIMTEEIIQKVWTSLNSIHFIATYLDPTLKSFIFVKSKRNRVNLLQSAREGIMLVFREKLIPPLQFQIEESQMDEPLLPPSPKFLKVDPLLSFRRGGTAVSINKCTDWNETNLKTELTRYDNITCIQYVEEIFEPIKWWGEQSYKFLILSYLSQSFLVIQASSAESERHFSSAGRVTRKDRGRLNPETVEGLVLLNDALKKE